MEATESTEYEQLSQCHDFKTKLNELYNDTLKCFSDIHKDSLLKHTETLFVTDIEKAQVDKVVKGVPTLFFVGQTNSGKSSVINELLGKTICPASQNPSAPRPVKLNYGSLPFVRLVNKASKEVGTVGRKFHLINGPLNLFMFVSNPI
eukprot:sb/3473744/